MFFLKKVWKAWLKFGLFIGNIVSGIVLTVFYYTVFALFAVPFSVFGKNPLKSQSENSNWLIKKKTINELKDFENEF